MSNDPDGFAENAQTPLSPVDDSATRLTAEEQASYDAWLKARVDRSLQKIRDGEAEFTAHADVRTEMKAYLADLDRARAIK